MKRTTYQAGIDRNNSCNQSRANSIRAITALVCIILLSLSVACNRADDSQRSGQVTSRNTDARVRFDAPSEWISEEPSSEMRAAQYRLPAAEGDSEDASLVVYYFGPGQGGSARMNLDRWISQMEQPDGRPSKDKASIEETWINGLKASILDISGTYKAEMMPGGGERYNKPSFRMKAAVIETPRGPYFVKLVGPEKTIARWQDSFTAFTRSFRFQ